MPSPVLHRPAALRPGQRIAAVAPASAPSDPEATARGIRYLRSLGYDVVTPRPSYETGSYLSGDDATRLEEFNRALQDPDIDALFCVRGGYGCLRLLPHLDYAAARDRAKLLVGYSDITALQLALYGMAGWSSLSGPMIAPEWGTLDDATEADFWAHAAGTLGTDFRNLSDEPLTALQPGTATGPLLGGNLSMIVRLLGTPYLPDLEGAVLFVEDIGEPPYRLDALFAQLALGGVLQQLSGLLIGSFTDWQGDNVRGTPDMVVRDYAGEVPGPVVTGLAYGHHPRKNTLPIGPRVRLQASASAATLHFLEPAVHP